MVCAACRGLVTRTELFPGFSRQFSRRRFCTARVSVAGTWSVHPAAGAGQQYPGVAPHLRAVRHTDPGHCGDRNECRQETFFKIAESVKQQLGGISGMLYVSSLGPPGSGRMNREQMDDYFARASSGDCEIFAACSSVLIFSRREASRNCSTAARFAPGIAATLPRVRAATRAGAELRRRRDYRRLPYAECLRSIVCSHDRSPPARMKLPPTSGVLAVNCHASSASAERKHRIIGQRVLYCISRTLRSSHFIGVRVVVVSRNPG